MHVFCQPLTYAYFHTHVCTNAGNCRPWSLDAVIDSLTVLILYMELQYCFWNWSLNLHSWAAQVVMINQIVRHSWKGIYTNVNLLEIRTDLNWELNRYHYMTRRIKLWKLSLGVDLVNNRQTGRLCAVDQTSYICLIICGAVTRISEVEGDWTATNLATNEYDRDD